MIYDSIVIGAGPAGIAAAVQMERAGLNIILFEKGEVGGLLRNANIVENYLGFSGGISGAKLIENFKDHIKKQNIALVHEEVLKITQEKAVFAVHTSNGIYKSNTVIIATGTIPKKANMEGETILSGTRLFYEIRDLPKMSGKMDIIIIGGGDAGFDYALNLHGQGHTPLILTKGEAKCLPLLRGRAQKSNIPCIEHCCPTLLRQSGNRIDVLCGDKCFKADYILVAVGRVPSTLPVMAVHTQGLYYVGDVRNRWNRHVHIATGDAMRAAMNIINYTLHKTPIC